MPLAYDWKHIIKRAWSFRLSVLAFIFEAAELVLPIFIDDFQRYIFAGLSVTALLGSMWARVYQQKRYYQ